MLSSSLNQLTYTSTDCVLYLQEMRSSVGPNTAPSDVLLTQLLIRIRSVADQHYMYVTVNECGQMKYNTMPYLHSYPVTVLLYGEILFLGMESGKV